LIGPLHIARRTDIARYVGDPIRDHKSERRRQQLMDGWCRRWDSNPHWRAPKARASAVGLRRRVATRAGYDSDSKILAQFGDVSGGADVVERLADAALRVDHEGGSDHAGDRPAVHLLLPVSAVGG
jgi:hypothetical protein